MVESGVKHHNPNPIMCRGQAVEYPVIFPIESTSSIRHWTALWIGQWEPASSTHFYFDITSIVKLQQISHCNLFL